MEQASRYRAHIAPGIAWDSNRLFITRDTNEYENGWRKTQVANGFTWTDHIEGDAWFSADGIGRADELIQAIVNEAWRVGFRPTGFEDTKNETTAIKQHLADMKTIAFHQLKIKAGE